MGVIGLAARDTIGDLKGAGASFSSWDKCMAKAYCKWPAIIAIVIGSLIVLSILFCLIRCMCCGLECCCGICGCFNHCCPGPRRNKGPRYAEQPASYGQQTGYHGYQPAPTMPPAYNGPQTATFDASKGKVNEDSLPAMPSWDNAPTKKVEDERRNDNLEMESMNNHSTAGLGAAAAAGAGAGAAAHHRHGEKSPNPYGSSSPTHPYGGNTGTPGRNYDYGRPSMPINNNNNSYGSGYSSPSAYTAPSVAPQPTAHTRPEGGFRNPPSEDQFSEDAMAPSPHQFHSQLSNIPGSSLYQQNPSTNYSQVSGVAPRSPATPKDNQPPSILQAGRKPAAGSWKDV